MSSKKKGGGIFDCCDTSDAADSSSAPPPPPARTWGWEKHTSPHPDNPDYEVTFYYNPATGESTYERPPDFVDEQMSDASDIYPPRSWMGDPPAGAVGSGEQQQAMRPPYNYATNSNQKPGLKQAAASEGSSKNPLQSVPENKVVKCTVPHPDNPDYEVTYYHNLETGESTYERPPDFVDEQMSDLSDIYPPMSWMGD